MVSHAGLLPVGRCGRDLGDHRRDQLIGELTITAVSVQPARPRPVDIPAHRFAVSTR